MSRTLSSIRLLARAYELQKETAEAVRDEVRRLLSREKNLNEVIIEDATVDLAPLIRGSRCRRIGLMNSTVHLHDDDNDVFFSEYVLTGAELLCLLKDLETLVTLLEKNVLILVNGVVRKA